MGARVAEQKAILAEGARYVRPGGMLVYITCSILDDENGAQAADFLAAHAEFEAVPVAPHLDAISAEARSHVHFPAQGGVLLTPLKTETDGFFALLMRKR